MRWRSSVVCVVWPSSRKGWNRRMRQPAEEGLKLAGDVEVRVEVAAHALDGHQRPDQEHQVGRNVQLVGSNEGDQLAEQEAKIDVVERELRNRYAPAR